MLLRWILITQKPIQLRNTDKKPENILIVVNAKGFSSSSQINKAFNTTRGNIHIEYASKEEAKVVYDRWQPEYFEEASVVGTITYTAKHNRAVIIKVVPKKINWQGNSIFTE